MTWHASTTPNRVRCLYASQSHAYTRVANSVASRCRGSHVWLPRRSRASLTRARVKNLKGKPTLAVLLEFLLPCVYMRASPQPIRSQDAVDYLTPKPTGPSSVMSLSNEAIIGIVQIFAQIFAPLLFRATIALYQMLRRGQFIFIRRANGERH